ncbi:MAG: hypothetical protein Q9228_001186 [Teloschistes exilis]
MAEALPKNFIDYEEYPQTAEIQNRCVSMIARMFNAPTYSDEESAMGTSTVGSSEAIMLGVLSMKRRWQNKRKAEGKDYSKPNMVMNAAVQVCWEKAARYFEVEERYSYCTESRYVIDPEEAVNLVDENTIGICAIIGTTYTGEYEDVKAINDLLVQKNIDCPIHVDAASGGFVAPFVVPELPWDFRLERVVSINVSGHKYGLVYPGVGWVVWRSPEFLPKELVFNINYLGADQASFTLNFSKGASQVIGQYYQMIRLGKRGYRSIMMNLTRTADYLAANLKQLGFIIMSKGGGQGLPLVAFRIDPKKGRHYDEFAVAHQLRERGWVVPAYTMAPHSESLKLMRVVVREDFSRSRCDALVKDIKLALQTLDEMDKKTVEKHQEHVKKNTTHHKSKPNHPHYKKEKHSLQGKHGKTPLQHMHKAEVRYFDNPAMPSRASKHFFHKNRSQASFLPSHDANGGRDSYHASPIESPLHSPGFPPPAAALHDDSDGQLIGHPYPAEDLRPYQPGLLTRSQSQRSPPTHIYPANYQQPTIQLVGPPAGQQHSSSPSTIDEDPDSYYHQAPTPKPQKEEPKRRRFFGLGSSSKEPNTSAPAPTAIPQRLGRSISVRTKNYGSQIPPAVTGRPVQQRWPSESSGSTYPRPASEEDDEREADRSLNGPAPPIPDKDSLRSFELLSGPLRDAAYRRPSVQSVVTDVNGRPRFERQGSATSATWDSPQSIQRIHPDSHQHPLSYQPSPSSATTTSSHPLSASSHRGQPDALHYHQQELENSRPPSQQSYNPPSPIQTHPLRFDSAQPRSAPATVPASVHHLGSMGPPQPQQSRDRRSQELAQSQQNPQSSGARESAGYQPYHQSTQTQGQPQGPPPAYSSQLSVNNQPNNTYRGPQTSPMTHQNTAEQGRNTPPPSRSRDDLSNLDVASLVSRHDELQDKYRKVKKYYFDKEAQVQQLQNTLAHQRLAQSRTSLDDNEYVNRFSRLDGAINNLAFNIRREWRSVPPWLAPAVNKDATTNPTKEMTAVGRACISRWLVDELFDRFFHPGLEPGLSTQLKIIEKNLRRFAPPTPTDEEREGLVAKISNWRLATLEGLSEVLNSASATENRTTLTNTLVEKMVAALNMNLKDPAPPGLEGGVSMIVELAVGIAANLPLESRDVFVQYVYPNARIDEGVMKLETGLPALTNPGEGLALDDTASRSSIDKDHAGADDESSMKENDDSPESQQSQAVQQKDAATASVSTPAANSKKKSGMFGGFIGGKKASAVPSGSGVATQQQQQAQKEKEQQQREKDKDKEERVRFCAFMAVEVRGRSVLIKAPVWTHGG